MLQMRKLRFCRIFANFFQCCFMSETQVLVAVSDFLDFHFLGNSSRMGTSFFNDKVCISVGVGFIFRCDGVLRGGINFDEIFFKKHAIGGTPPAPLSTTLWEALLRGVHGVA